MPFRYFFDHGARWGALGRTGAHRGVPGRSLAVAIITNSTHFSKIIKITYIFAILQLLMDVFLLTLQERMPLSISIKNLFLIFLREY